MSKQFGLEESQEFNDDTASPYNFIKDTIMALTSGLYTKQGRDTCKLSPVNAMELQLSCIRQTRTNMPMIKPLPIEITKD